MPEKFQEIVDIIRFRYGKTDFIPLHAPYFGGNEKKYLNECIDSTYVSSVGAFVDRFEADMCKITGSKFAIATVNGTSALHIALLLAGVSSEDEVITQALSFVATSNAISYCNAQPVFIDVDVDTMGLSPEKLRVFLENETTQDSEGNCINKRTGKVIRACVPMHTFGLALRIKEICEICRKYNICVIEDAAESLGTTIENKHTGTFGELGVFSFNGNKTVTSGGGGAIITDSENLAKLAKHLTTTAKQVHPFEFVHDQIAYNYRLPNINAALAVAQLEQLETILQNKRETALYYKKTFATIGIEFKGELENTSSNFWLNAIQLKDKSERDAFLEFTNANGVMTRPIWTLMNKLNAFKNCQKDDLSNSIFLEDRIVNIPSSYIPKA